MFSCGDVCDNVFAEYYQIGIQPLGGTLAAGQPMQFTTAGQVTPGISAGLAQVNSGVTGTVFTLVYPGTYQITYRTGFTGNGSISVYRGTAVTSLSQVDKSLVGHSGAPNDVTVNGIIHMTTTVANELFSINAAAGNVATLNFPALATATNSSVSHVTIQRIS